jgi:hypothetical protein
MNTKLLIDAIVRQTTVLIAQLSTAAGIRAPLANIADQVFVELAREIESHGVSRKVAADMFGLAIRTYQKKVQRLSESVSMSDRTLWQAVLEYIQSEATTTRRDVLRRFHRDDAMVVSSVLNDLVSSGIVERRGAGEGALFSVAPERDLLGTAQGRERDAATAVVWLIVYRSAGMTPAAIAETLQLGSEVVALALETLQGQGLLRCVDVAGVPTYQASTFVVPIGAEHGWEAAVFDHFQAVVRAIGLKVRQGTARSSADHVVGGATLGFDITPGHPYEARVLGTLQRVREEVNVLWNEVQDYNALHPISDDERTEVLFYFGQSVTGPDDE